MWIKKSLYGYASKNPLNFRRVAGTDLFYVDDKEYDFKEILNAPLPKCPRDVTFTAHWLAVEGVQPAIPQNPPVVVEPEQVLQEHKKATTEVPGAIIKNIVKHTLSNELQLYYETTTNSILGDNKNLQQAALNSIANDPGVQQLLPYFIQFVEDKVLLHLRKLSILTNLMKVVNALLENEHIQIEPYLHQLMPPVMTCLVGKKLCSKPTEDHWSLRDRSAAIVSLICNKFSGTYTNLKPRISKTLLHAFLDTSKPLCTHYGGIVGLAALGPYTVQVLVLPNVSAYMKILQPELTVPGRRSVEARKCYDALLNAAGNCLHHFLSQPNGKAGTVIEYYKELHSIFGESLMSFLPQEDLAPSI